MENGLTKIVITGAAGLVGQNLIVTLKEMGYSQITALDKSAANLSVLKQLHPEISAQRVDLAQPGDWVNFLREADVLVMLHAQIGGLDADEFHNNNVVATELCLEALAANPACYIVHVSSSVVTSKADDLYTRSKATQEKLVLEARNPSQVLRPTLMFGWFDRKHFGWLSRFMRKVPVFPIPGDGNYLRQPLFARDFCAVIASCIEQRTQSEPVSITGKQILPYIDIVRTIRDVLHCRTWILSIPYGLFYGLLQVYAWFDRDPPFTVFQLEALVTDELFEEVDWEGQFGVRSTDLSAALEQTFTDPKYSDVVLEF